MDDQNIRARSLTGGRWEWALANSESSSFTVRVVNFPEQAQLCVGFSFLSLPIINAQELDRQSWLLMKNLMGRICLVTRGRKTTHINRVMAPIKEGSIISVQKDHMGWKVLYFSIHGQHLTDTIGAPVGWQATHLEDANQFESLVGIIELWGEGIEVEIFNHN